jgi:hypothetical protein
MNFFKRYAIKKQSQLETSEPEIYAKENLSPGQILYYKEKAPIIVVKANYKLPYQGKITQQAQERSLDGILHLHKNKRLP